MLVKGAQAKALGSQKNMLRKIQSMERKINGRHDPILDKPLFLMTKYVTFAGIILGHNYNDFRRIW